MTPGFPWTERKRKEDGWVRHRHMSTLYTMKPSATEAESHSSVKGKMIAKLFNVSFIHT